MKAVMDAAVEGAKEGVEATKEMTPKYGKAAVFAARAKGVEDQGAVAGMYLMGRTSKIFQLTGTPVSSIFISQRKPLQQHAAGAFSMRLGLILHL